MNLRSQDIFPFHFSPISDMGQLFRQNIFNNKCNVPSDLSSSQFTFAVMIDKFFILKISPFM